MSSENSLFNRLIETKDPQEIYRLLIELGKTLPSFNPNQKIEQNRVAGCQSVMYLSFELKESRIFYSCESESLISKGIAAFCIHLANGKTPEEVVQSSFDAVQKISLPILLSPSRANGLMSLIKKMKQHALSAILMIQRLN